MTRACGQSTAGRWSCDEGTQEDVMWMGEGTCDGFRKREKERERERERGYERMDDRWKMPRGRCC